MDRLFFIVRQGTNVRAVSKDDEPIIVPEEAIDEAIAFYDRNVPLRTIPLEAILIDDYYRKFRLPVLRAKAGLQMIVESEKRSQVQVRVEEELV